MSKVILALVVLNSITGFALGLCVNYTYMCYKTAQLQLDQIDYLRDKICRVEKELNFVKQDLEEVEENVSNTKRTLTRTKAYKDIGSLRSNREMANLDEFINFGEED